MAKSIKGATTYEEQIELLKSRGLIITDEEEAVHVLSRLNDYTFTGYLHDFKNADGTYPEGLTFEKVYKIYEFDKRFRNILLYTLEVIENTLITKISYNFAHSYEPLEYLNSDIFKDKEEHNIFLKKFHHNVKSNKNLSFVKHHKIHYEGFPIWVAVELFTMGMVYNFYINLPTSLQKIIAKEFNTGVNQLSSWIENITYIRNLVAHYMRLYNCKLQKTPVKCKRNHKYYSANYLIFDILYIMKFLILDNNDWNNNIASNIKSLILEYEEYIDLDCIGFPAEWEELLRK